MTGWQPGFRADATRIVADGYDAMGERFDRWADAAVESPRQAFLADLVASIAPGAQVLEIGCGSGARGTAELAERFALTGVDVSARQVARARRRIPGAAFLVGDVLEVDLGRSRFGGVVAFYVVNHIPVADLPTFYGRIAGWLVPGGWFGANLPVSDAGDGVETSWLGVPMFFASVSANENLRLLTAAGLEVISANLVVETEPDEDGASTEVAWQWVLARRRED